LNSHLQAGIWRALRTAGCLTAALVIVGCTQSRPVHYLGDKDLSYYKDAATQVDYLSESPAHDETALFTEPPRTIRSRIKDEPWEMPLVEALHTALANTEIIRTRSQFAQTGPASLATAASIQDIAIQETGVVFGQRGVEAALSDFDGQFATNMRWGRSEQVQNNLFTSGGIPPGGTLVDETATFTSQLQKQFAHGGLFAVSHNVDYSLNNAPSRLFGSVYNGNIRGEYRHPLLAGSGTEFNRIAGPNNRGQTGLSGVAQGVVIARINNDIAITDFEASVRDMLKDAEDLYWELSLAYRTYHAEVVARNSAIQTWREAHAKFESKLLGTADVAQAEQSVYDAIARAENALADIYETETRLRRQLGLPVNDQRVIVPSDEPVVADFIPDWHMCLAEALTRRPELRRAKWSIKSLELRLKAARSLTRPSFDAVASTQINAFGDHLFSKNDNDGTTPQGLSSFYETMAQQRQTAWEFGFQFSMPLGFRAVRTQVRNLELQLARERARLTQQERDISQQLSIAFQQLDRTYVTARSNSGSRRAAEQRVAASRAEFDTGGTTIDLVLRAQIALAQAETAFYSSITAYNRAITQLHYQKGTLLEENNVHLAEGMWDPEAYDEALRRAWARSHGHDNPLLHTEPREFVAPEAHAEEVLLQHFATKMEKPGDSQMISTVGERDPRAIHEEDFRFEDPAFFPDTSLNNHVVDEDRGFFPGRLEIPGAEQTIIKASASSDDGVAEELWGEEKPSPLPTKSNQRKIREAPEFFPEVSLEQDAIGEDRLFFPESKPVRIKQPVGERLARDTSSRRQRTTHEESPFFPEASTNDPTFADDDRYISGDNPFFETEPGRYAASGNASENVFKSASRDNVKREPHKIAPSPATPLKSNGRKSGRSRIRLVGGTEHEPQRDDTSKPNVFRSEGGRKLKAKTPADARTGKSPVARSEQPTAQKTSKRAPLVINAVEWKTLTEKAGSRSVRQAKHASKKRQQNAEPQILELDESGEFRATSPDVQR